MAVTLPFPDMEFVPLDILTAQEQNQLVANIEYLAGLFPLGSPEIAENAILNTKINNGAVTEFKIADGAVTSGKIDFTSFGGQFETEYTLTGSLGGKCRVLRLGEVGFVVGETNAFSYSGSYSTTSTNIPTTALPSGSIVLVEFISVTSVTGDDAQYSHGRSGSTVGSAGLTITLPAICTTESGAKSCKFGFVIPFIYP